MRVPFAVYDTPPCSASPHPFLPGITWNLLPSEEPGTSEPVGPARTPGPEPGTWNPNSKFFSARLRRAVRTRNLEPAHTGGRNRNLGTLYGAKPLVSGADRRGDRRERVRRHAHHHPRLRPAARRAARHHQPRLIGRRLAAAACLRSDEEGWLSSLQTLSFFGSRCTTRRESVLCALLVPSVGVQ